VLVIGYLTGTSLENDSFADDGVLARAAVACRRLHAGPRFVDDFDMFARQAAYLRTVQEQGFPLPPGYGDHADAWAEVQRAVAARPRVTVPCNNDLLAGNFIDDGDRVWLIDYEYSGNNDVAFELGNTCTECEFPPERVDAYAEAYYGSPTRGDLARVRLGALRSEYGWALWGFIQAASSPLDFDFHDWGMHRFEKAARTFTSDGFDRLLEEAVGD
jgi:thiamine kinase-like enzyme